MRLFIDKDMNLVAKFGEYTSAEYFHQKNGYIQLPKYKEDELIEIKNKYGDERRTQIIAAEGEIETEKYSTKTNIPQYEIQGLNIKLSDCIDKQKYIELLKEIENSTVSDAQKKFLKLAATRHIRFIYKNIAEYYASTNSEMQRLMEHSALVIIDIDDAIRNGYARLTKEVMAARKRDSKKNEE